MTTYTSVITLDGQAKIADAIGGVAAVDLSHLAVGDGSGAPVAPLETMEALVNEVWRGAVTSASRDPQNPTHLIVTAVIPESAGPFSVREAALFSADGKMFALASYPETFKPGQGEGAVAEISLEFVVVVDTAATVNITLAPAQLTSIGGLLRPPFISIDSFSAEPPANPMPGALSVVAENATGAFTGLEHRFAQWTGSVWVNIDAPLQTIVGLAGTEKYFRRIASGWEEIAIGSSALDNALAYPEVTINDGVLSITSSTGEVVVADGGTFLHRNHRIVNTDDTPIASRTFSTTADSVYHLRWRWNGTAGSYVLISVTDSGYNPSSLPEADQAFDTTYDDMLIAYIGTDGSNVPTVYPLVNKDRLRTSVEQIANITSSENATASVSMAVSIQWARRPDYTFSITRYITTSVDSDHDFDWEPTRLDRYGTSGNLQMDHVYQTEKPRILWGFTA